MSPAVSDKDRVEPTKREEPPRNGTSPPPPRRVLVEVLGVFALATALFAAFWQLRGVVPFIGKNLHALIAAVFLYVPTALLLRRREDFVAYGLTLRPLGKGVAIFLAGIAVVFPLFAAGFFVYYRVVCGAALGRIKLPRGLTTLCRSWVGSWRRVHLRLPADFAQLALAQLLV